MSVQFGRWNLDGRPTEPGYLEKVKAVIAPYGPDDSGSYSKGNVSILYRAFHTTKESRHEVQPHVTSSGTVITWDGRLDIRAELIHLLNNVLTVSATDVEIVAAAYEEWGTNCFAKLIGDWALSMWDANTHSLILAKDPIGTRHLYYSLDKDQVTWCTLLDPLVLFAGKTFSLCEEYIAGWLSFSPAVHLTPYVGIHAVPPSSSVLIRAGKHTVSKYWDFDPSKQIRYNTDAEYEEHFRTVFAEAVRRRLRSDRSILAELSGGMDSSSIVCMADTVIARGVAETPWLDTVSYYQDSEPNWNERPYFTKVEEKRGRAGCHIDVGKEESFTFEIDSDHFAAAPGSHGRPNEAAKQFAACVTSQGNRVVLSGIGGDEVMGGVPTPTPELANLLASGSFRKLARQLKVWALTKRKPWFHLFFETFREFLPAALTPVPNYKKPVPWLNPHFVQRNRTALQGYESRIHFLGPSPSFQFNLGTLEALRRQLGCSTVLPEPVVEKRYPFFDRDLLEFAYSVPREQIVRPGQRRSLMRRALRGIVPDEILNRKRKAYVTRAPLAAISAEKLHSGAMSQDMTSSALGIVDGGRFSETLRLAWQGHEVPLAVLIRTLGIESWLSNLGKRHILAGGDTGTPDFPDALGPAVISAEKK